MGFLTHRVGILHSEGLFTQAITSQIIHLDVQLDNIESSPAFH